MDVAIEDWNADGRGRAWVGKRAALISQALPGERVQIRIDRESRGTIQGRVVRLLDPSPDRVESTCPHRFRCTGCALLEASPDAERQFKAERIASALADLRIPALQPMISSPDPFGYRHYAKWVGLPGPRAAFGAFVTGTHEVEPLTHCPVLAPGLNEVLVASRRAFDTARIPVVSPEGGRDGVAYVVARKSRAEGTLLLGWVVTRLLGSWSEALVGAAEEVMSANPAVVGVHVLPAGKGNALLGEHPLQSFGAEHVTEVLLGHRHRVGPTTFFQINPAAAEILFREALSAVGTGSRVVEGHAGVGALTAPLAQRFEEVLASETHPASVACLRDRPEARNGRVTVDPRPADVVLAERLPLGGFDAAIMDPPRSGLGLAVEPLARWGPPRCVLLSCDPQSLTRDLPPLLGAGYQVERVVPVDQFPRTAHVETVTLLTRGDAR